MTSQTRRNCSSHAGECLSPVQGLHPPCRFACARLNVCWPLLAVFPCAWSNIVDRCYARPRRTLIRECDCFRCPSMSPPSEVVCLTIGSHTAAPRRMFGWLGPIQREVDLWLLKRAIVVTRARLCRNCTGLVLTIDSPSCPHPAVASWPLQRILPSSGRGTALFPPNSNQTSKTATAKKNRPPYAFLVLIFRGHSRPAPAKDVRRINRAERAYHESRRSGGADRAEGGVDKGFFVVRRSAVAFPQSGHRVGHLALGGGARHGRLQEGELLLPSAWRA